MSFSTSSTGTKTLSMFSVCTRVNVYPADLRKKPSKKEKQKERKTKKGGGGRGEQLVKRRFLRATSLRGPETE